MLIEVSSVSKRYKSAQETIEALQGATLSLAAGDYVSIVGPSGAGKSTLLHVLAGLDQPSQGEVKFQGQDIYAYSDAQRSLWRARHIGFVFQFYHLIEELSVWENVLLPLRIYKRNYSLKAVDELLQYLDIDSRRDFYPSQLSGGEKQKVAFARALANDPEIILCDEPTGNLDYDSQVKVVQFLAWLHRERKKTIVVVTHNIALAKNAAKTLGIERGRVFSAESAPEQSDKKLFGFFEK